MPVIGHDAVRAELERELPPVTLLLGPDSIGKVTLALQVAYRYSPGGAAAYYPQLTAAQARDIVDCAPVMLRPPDIRVIDLSAATEAAQNILLKVLEEPPAHCRFILASSRPPLSTIISRARVYQLGLLSDGQVARVLEQHGVNSVEAAVQAATRGRGRVAPALQAATDRDRSRVSSVVAAAVRAATENGSTAMEMALRNWTPEHTRVLERWATEKANGRWVAFSPDFAPRATRRGALNVLFALSAYDARTAPAVALNALKEPK